MTVDSETEQLRTIPAFAHLETSKLKLLAFTSARGTHADGEVLFRQGEPGDAVYVVIDGTAEVVIEGPDGEFVIARLCANDIFGEVAVLCDVPRTATLRAVGDLNTLIMPKDVFFRLVTENPSVGLDFMRLMAQRYNNTIDHMLRHIA